MAAAAAAAPSAWHGAFDRPPVKLTMTPHWGNGLLATRDIAPGEVVFTETPLSCVTLSNVPHCDLCSRSMAPPSLAGLEAGDRELELWPAVAAVACERGCTAVYCSTHCRDTALSTYHSVVCPGLPAAVVSALEQEAVPLPATAAEELLQFFEGDSEEEAAEADEPRAAAATHARQAEAALELRTYCQEVLGEGPLEHCCEFPLMVLRLVAMALALARRPGGDTLLRQPFCNAPATAEAGPESSLFGGRAAFARRSIEALPALIDYSRVHGLVAGATHMSAAELAWVDHEALKRCFSLCFSNTIRIFPRTPFDCYLGRLRRAPSLQRRAGMEKVWVAVDAVVAGEAEQEAAEEEEEQAGGGGSGSRMGGSHSQIRRPLPGELDAVMRRRVAPRGVCALFRLHSKINHACESNCIAQGYNFDSCLLQVVSTRPLVAGEQLTLCYTDPQMPARTRREALEHSHGIHCSCPRCAANQQLEPGGKTWRTSPGSSGSSAVMGGGGMGTGMGAAAAAWSGAGVPEPEFHGGMPAQPVMPPRAGQGVAPTTAMKLNPETGLLEKFHSHKLQDDFPAEEAVDVEVDLREMGCDVFEDY